MAVFLYNQELQEGNQQTCPTGRDQLEAYGANGLLTVSSTRPSLNYQLSDDGLDPAGGVLLSPDISSPCSAFGHHSVSDAQSNLDGYACLQPPDLYRAGSQQSISSHSMSPSASNHSESLLAPVRVRPPPDYVLDRFQASTEDNTTIGRQIGRDHAEDYIAIKQSYAAQACRKYDDTNMTPALGSSPDAMFQSTSVYSASPATDGSDPPSRPTNFSYSGFGVELPRTHVADLRSNKTDAYSVQEEEEPVSDAATCSERRHTASVLFGVGYGAHSHLFSPCHSPSYPGDHFSHLEETPMNKSTSNTTGVSGRSKRSSHDQRSQEALEQTVRNANTWLAPKPHGQTMDEGDIDLEDTASKSQGRKTGEYRRPKHPKIYCTQCKTHPEGFKGEHELNRHKMAKHAEIVKKFVVRDPAEVGLQTSVKVVRPLDKCKACVSKKEYGAYYNAAAHLRRQHFNPNPQRGQKTRTSEVKRAGIGGGSWPPMAELKIWFEEVMVPGSTSLSADVDASGDEVSSNSLEEYAVDPNSSIPGIQNTYSGFGMVADFAVGVVPTHIDASPIDERTSFSGESTLPPPIVLTSTSDSESYPIDFSSPDDSSTSYLGSSFPLFALNANHL